MAEQEDRLFRLYDSAEEYCTKARQLLTAYPQGDPLQRDHVLRRLRAFIPILIAIDDPDVPRMHIDNMLNEIEDCARQLAGLAPVDHAPNFILVRSGGRGRPQIQLPLQLMYDLYQQGSTWEDIADMVGVDRTTIYRRFKDAGIETVRTYSNIPDGELDAIIRRYFGEHPDDGQQILNGHLLALGHRVPRDRLRASVHRVDVRALRYFHELVTFRREYQVRGSNALWHMDGNEKLVRGGLYVHGCIDGYSRKVIYLECRFNKLARTVWSCFRPKVAEFGWPSRVRADFGTENNVVEQKMIEHWGGGDVGRFSYLRGRPVKLSVHNVRIERLWRDIGKTTLRAFAAIFRELRARDLFVLENRLHRLALIVVYQPRVQASLDEALLTWNAHALSTERHRSPNALYTLSRAAAILGGYWHHDPGDDAAVVAADPLYGVDDADDLEPEDEDGEDGPAPGGDEGEDGEGLAGNGFEDEEALNLLGIQVEWARAVLGEFDVKAQDYQVGMTVYVQVLTILEANAPNMPE